MARRSRNRSLSGARVYRRSRTVRVTIRVGPIAGTKMLAAHACIGGQMKRCAIGRGHNVKWATKAALQKLSERI